ncbi:hypothetical protein F5Y17DRAFT_287683 [Xylariaceae sp. FL0594]|nr:hypothetical protein F5Y17DRAFT_287683 [Xylariaceae sp. FL0594]
MHFQVAAGLAMWSPLPLFVFVIGARAQCDRSRNSCYDALFPCSNVAALNEAVEYCSTVGAYGATNYPIQATAACGSGGKAPYFAACRCAVDCPIQTSYPGYPYPVSTTDPIISIVSGTSSSSLSSSTATTLTFPSPTGGLNSSCTASSASCSSSGSTTESVAVSSSSGSPGLPVLTSLSGPDVTSTLSTSPDNNNNTMSVPTTTRGSSSGFMSALFPNTTFATATQRANNFTTGSSVIPNTVSTPLSTTPSASTVTAPASGTSDTPPISQSQPGSSETATASSGSSLGINTGTSTSSTTSPSTSPSPSPSTSVLLPCTPSSNTGILENGGFENGLSPWSVDLVDLFSTEYALLTSPFPPSSSLPSSPGGAGANGTCTAFVVTMTSNPQTLNLRENLRLRSDLVFTSSSSFSFSSSSILRISFQVRFAERNAARLLLWANDELLRVVSAFDYGPGGPDAAGNEEINTGGEQEGGDEEDDGLLWTPITLDYTTRDRLLQLSFSFELDTAVGNTVALDEVGIFPSGVSHPPRQH